MTIADDPAPVDVGGLDLPLFDCSAEGVTGGAFHRQLAAVAKQGWLARSPLAYLVLEREAGEFFLRARQSAFPGMQIADLFGVTGGPLREQVDANILNATGDRHRRLRSLVGPSFTPRAAARWRPDMRRFLAGLWEGLGGATECEFVSAFAKPYPALTVAAVLGAPPGDAPRLHEWSGWVQRQFDIRALAAGPERIERAAVELQSYVEALLAERAREPSDDLVSALLTAEADGDKLTRAECVQLALNVIAGAVDTTQSQLSHAMRLFSVRPDQWELLGERPDLVPRAVEEVLRFEPATPFTARICLEPVEYRGVLFPAGTIVAVCAERANREGEAGEGFDIAARRDGRVLTFGAGAHHCLGVSLARAELAEALAFLAPRMPGLRPAGPVALGGVEGIYGVESLPLAWSPTQPLDAPGGRRTHRRRPRRRRIR